MTETKNWFSQPGNLDDSSDTSYESAKSTSTVPETIEKNNYDSSTNNSDGGLHIKPVKGLKDPAANTYSDLTTGSAAPSSVETSRSNKVEHRCSNCGAVVPEGTSLCLKCTASKYIDKSDVKEKVVDVKSVIVKNKKPFIIIASCSLILVLLLVVVIANTHKLSGKYSYKENEVVYETIFDYDGSVSIVVSVDGEIYGSSNGRYYWNSNEHRYYLEFPTENWWGGYDTAVLYAEPFFGGLRVSGHGTYMEMKRSW